MRKAVYLLVLAVSGGVLGGMVGLAWRHALGYWQTYAIFIACLVIFEIACFAYASD